MVREVEKRSGICIRIGSPPKLNQFFQLLDPMTIILSLDVGTGLLQK